jgi:hypothetical protein
MRTRPFSFALCFVVVACGSSEKPLAKPASGTAPAGESAPGAKTELPLPVASPPPSAVPPGPSSACRDACAKLLDDADRLVEQAQAMQDEKSKPGFFRRAGEGLLRAWRGCYLEVPAGADLGCIGGPDVVAKMADAFGASGHDDKVIYAGLIALDPRWSTLAPEPVKQKLAEAAGRAETLASRDAKAEGAAELLEMAAYARVALGDGAKALADASAYRQRYPQNRKEGLPIFIAIGRLHDDRAKWAEAVAALGAAPAAGDEPRAKILWHAEHARALVGAKRPALADLSAVAAAWPSEPAAAAKVAGPMAPRPIPDREATVEAVGAAAFLRVEPKRLAAEALAPPRYAGPETSEAFSKFVAANMADWAKQKQARIRDVAEGYKAVGAIRPMPPARWVAAAAAATGQLEQAYIGAWKDVVSGLKDAELRAVNDKKLDESLAPVVKEARAAFTTCVETAKKGHIDDESSRGCARWLADHAK